MHYRIHTLALAALTCAPLALAQDGGVYQEAGGLVVVEIESTPALGGWSEETVKSGYTFLSYYRWDGGDLFNTPGVDPIGFRVELNQGGKYFLALRNRHDHPDDTEENDVWVRMDGGTWFKLFSNGPANTAVWNWDSRFDISGQPPASWTLSAGEHLIEFSGRSQNFKMDRFHLHLQGNPNANDENEPESVALLGASYCGPAVSNSTGGPARILAWGSTFVVNDDVTLEALDLPTNEFGYFVVSQTQGFVSGPGGAQGNLCLGGSIGRYVTQVKNSGAAGRIDIVIDLNNVPTSPPSAVSPGETWSFQLWYRDKNPGTTSNFTDGRAVLFQ